MRLHLFLLFFCFIWVASFAQKFGVDIGYGYTINSFKLGSVADGRYSASQLDLKQKLFPNAMFRPYFKIYKKTYFYFGVDMSDYDFKYTMYNVEEPQRSYNSTLRITELHAPVMLRIEVSKFSQKYPLSFYGGMFGRFLTRAQTKIAWNYELTNGISDNNNHPTITIEEKKSRYTNFVAGIHQSFPFSNYLHGYADFQMKYIPGYYYVYDNFLLNSTLPMRITNRFAFTFSIGISFLKPEKEKGEFVNPTRLED